MIDEPPAELVGPCWIGNVLLGVAKATGGWPESFILWQLPFSRAVMYYLGAAMETPLYWTVAPGFGDPDATATAVPIAAQLDALETFGGLDDDISRALEN